ncbi:NUDIX hydrolase [Rhodotorula taiwanensis]|uniref:Cleavage and polyadenylation specificity factor subunit 5 n=1 Tax=Rhodotorula taiwanensis TaxID=741276 RepID=A0A2S5B3Y2_9BASI|nr:NUDIX hydrolase [Rhodotorula taiwanensis]
MADMPKHTIYPLSNYTFATKEAQHEELPTVLARLNRLETEFEQFGMRKTVEGLLVVHEHGHPHVLLLQVGNSYFKLPGDSLQPDEDEIFGLQQRMYLRLGPESGVDLKNGGVKAEDDAMNGVGSGGINDWTVGDAVGHFWRPNFETFMYPYMPAHISDPKERKTWYLIKMPERQILTVPKNMKLVALPLFELYDNAVRYGPQLASIPTLLSRIEFEYAS